MARLDDDVYMRECFRLARKGAGHVSPNPLVGAVLVRDGHIVARGYHHAYGTRHAEVDCLERYKGALGGAVLYVNLEPCSYQGKTPPCTEYLIRKGVSEVVVAMEDPNPRVAGEGIRRLRAAGTKVRAGVLEGDAAYLNRFFVKHISTGMPYVHLKIAQTLDGRIAGGASRWISSPASRRLVHGWRATHDAVLVGAGTVVADDPALTVRHGAGRDPAVVILDGKLRVRSTSRLFRTAGDRRVFLCTAVSAAHRSPRRVEELARAGVRVLLFDGEGTLLDLGQVLRVLYRELIGSLLVEGGAQVFTQFVREGLIDEVSLFIAPKLQGKGLAAFADVGVETVMRFGMRRMTATKVGKDLLINALKAD